MCSHTHIVFTKRKKGSLYLCVFLNGTYPLPIKVKPSSVWEDTCFKNKQLNAYPCEGYAVCFDYFKTNLQSARSIYLSAGFNFRVQHYHLQNSFFFFSFHLSTTVKSFSAKNEKQFSARICLPLEFSSASLGERNCLIQLKDT